MKKIIIVIIAILVAYQIGVCIYVNNNITIKYECSEVMDLKTYFDKKGIDFDHLCSINENLVLPFVFPDIEMSDAEKEDFFENMDDYRVINVSINTNNDTAFFNTYEIKFHNTDEIWFFGEIVDFEWKGPPMKNNPHCGWVHDKEALVKSDVLNKNSFNQILNNECSSEIVFLKILGGPFIGFSHLIKL